MEGAQRVNIIYDTPKRRKVKYITVSPVTPDDWNRFLGVIAHIYGGISFFYRDMSITDRRLTPCFLLLDDIADPKDTI
jgi:hypothetical protein